MAAAATAADDGNGGSSDLLRLRPPPTAAAATAAYDDSPYGFYKKYLASPGLELERGGPYMDRTTGELTYPIAGARPTASTGVWAGLGPWTSCPSGANPLSLTRRSEIETLASQPS